MTFMLSTPEAVRARLRLDGVIDGDDLRYGDGPIGSNIAAASAFLQRITRRQIEPQTGVTKRFTTNGRAIVPIVDLRSATSVTLQGVTLQLDQGDSSTAWLLPDRVEPSVYTSVQVRPFGGNWRANPQWFDRNLDTYASRGMSWSSLPNDLEVTGDWGHDPYPPDMVLAGEVLAAWYTKRPDALLANVASTLDGSLLNYAAMPPEVMDFLTAWRLREEMIVAGAP